MESEVLEVGKIEVPDTFPVEWVDDGALIAAICERTNETVWTALGTAPCPPCQFEADQELGKITIPITRTGHATQIAILRGNKVIAAGPLTRNHYVQQGDTAVIDVTYRATWGGMWPASLTVVL